MRSLAHLPLTVLLAAIGAVAMLVPTAHAAVLGDGRMVEIFAISATLGIVLAAVTGLASTALPPRHLPARFTPVACRPMVSDAAGNDARSMLLHLLAAMTILPGLLALPVWLALPDTGLLNAWWEMVSCLTTTGASLYDPGFLAAPLNLWRALVGWMGGLFTLVAATAIMAPLRIGGFEMAPDEARRAAVSRSVETRARAGAAGRVLKAGAAVVPVYVALTLGLWVLLLTLGDPGPLALGRAMGTLSTSGILVVPSTTHSASGIVGEIAVFAFLVLALSRRFWPGGGKLRTSPTWDRDPELRLAAGVICLVALILFGRHFIGAIDAASPRHDSLSEQIVLALRSGWGGLFNALSYLTTTGWNSIEWQGARRWSGLDSSGLLLAGLAIMGGGVATAAGGVKLLRVHALASHALDEMYRLPHPHSISRGGSVARWLRGEGAFLAFVFFMLFALSIAVFVSLLSLQRVAFENATILAIAALTNTGQLAGAIPLVPMDQGGAGMAGAVWDGWAGLPAVAKAVLAGAMILGRIETLALLALLNPEIWRR